MKGENELILNMDKLHTTVLGAERIKRNLSLDTEDVVGWCREKIQDADASIIRNGKNWYVDIEDCEITVNAYSYTIITAHRLKAAEGTGIKGKKADEGKPDIRIRPYKKCDAQYIVKWIKDERTFRKWCADRYETYPITAEDMNRHYEANAENDTFFEMTALAGNEVVGHFIMRFIDEEKMILRLGFVIVDDTKRGMGYGKEMVSLALKYAFEMLKVEKVTLGVFENNSSAYRCYKAAGFREVQEEKAEYFHVLGEDWKCLELEKVKSGFKG